MPLLAYWYLIGFCQTENGIRFCQPKRTWCPTDGHAADERILFFFLSFVLFFVSFLLVGWLFWCFVAPASASPRGLSRSLSLSPCWSLCPRSGDLDPPGETGMLVVAEEKCFMVMASTAVEKDAWLRAIRLCMRDLSTNVETRERMCGSQVGGWAGGVVGRASWWPELL